jgi:hypothetical protein
MKLIVDIFAGLGLCISLAGLGQVLAGRIFNYKADFHSAFFLGCGLGIVILFIGGLLKLFGPIYFIAILVFCGLFAIAGFRFLPSLLVELKKEFAFPLILAAILFAINGLAALSPPIKNDTLYYHLGLPKLWIESGGIPFYPTIAFSATALNCELLVTPIAAIISWEAAQFFVFLIAIITILYLARELRRFTNTPSYYGLIFLAALPLYVAGLSDSKNDYLAVGFCMAAIFLYFDYLKNKQAKYLALAGVFTGLAAGTKSNALIFGLAITMAVIIDRPRLRDFAYFIIGAAVLAIPWYLKAYIETSNPVYPFYNDIFHSLYWPNIFNDFNKATMPASVDRGILDFIISPFKLVYQPDLFRGRIGPLPLIFLPFFLVFGNHPKVIKRTLFVAAVFYFVWYAVWANARYLLPAVLLFAFAAAYIAYRAAAKIKSVNPVLIIATSMLIAVNIAQSFRDNSMRIKTAAGFIDREVFLAEAASLDPNNPGSGEKQKALPYYEIWQYANTALPKNAVVGILCSNWNRADGFYLDRLFMYVNPTEQKVVDFTVDSVRLENSLRQSGIDYFLVDNRVVDEFSEQSQFGDAPEFSRIADGVRWIVGYVRMNGRLEYQTARYQLYQIG